eukprot:746902-Hanusia_phi.AAC.5
MFVVACLNRKWRGRGDERIAPLPPPPTPPPTTTTLPPPPPLLLPPPPPPPPGFGLVFSSFSTLSLRIQSHRSKPRNAAVLSLLFLFSSIVSHPPCAVHHTAPAIISRALGVAIQRLRGGALIDEEDNDDELDMIETFKLPPPASKPKMSAMGPLHLTWSMAAPDAEGWRRQLLRHMDEPGSEEDQLDDDYVYQERARDSEDQQKWAKQGRKTQLFQAPSVPKGEDQTSAPTGQALSSTSAEIFRRFMLGIEKGSQEGDDKAKTDEGVSVLGRGIARELREEKRKRHLRLIEADESNKKKEELQPLEVEGPAPPGEDELLEQWHGPKNASWLDNPSAESGQLLPFLFLPDFVLS